MEVRTIIKKGREEKLWYAIRVTYNRELKVKDDLDTRGVTNFVPMQYRREKRGGVMVKRLVPSVHNLIFINMTPSEMTEYKKTTTLPIRYIMDRETHKPITVPNREMENFIKVAGTYNEKLIYLNPDPGDFAEGERVRLYDAGGRLLATGTGNGTCRLPLPAAGLYLVQVGDRPAVKVAHANGLQR